METMNARGFFTFECFGKDGNLKWTEACPNVITTQGKNALLDAYLGAGSGVTSYMTLITAGTPAGTQTYASPGNTEVTSPTISARVSMTWSSASAGSKAATSTSFSIGGTATITGNMVMSGGTGIASLGNTSATGGVLFSAATFGSSKSVASGDTLNVSYSVSV